MSNFVDLIAERLIRISLVISFALIRRTKSLFWGATKEQLFSSVLMLLSYQRRERMRERCYEVFCTSRARHCGGGQK